jgi:hypothetical protein
MALVYDQVFKENTEVGKRTPRRQHTRKTSTEAPGLEGAAVTATPAASTVRGGNRRKAAIWGGTA